MNLGFNTSTASNPPTPAFLEYIYVHCFDNPFKDYGGDFWSGIEVGGCQVWGQDHSGSAFARGEVWVLATAGRKM